MTPAELIARQFGDKFLIPLDDIAKPLLGVSPEVAKRLWTRKLLPPGLQQIVRPLRDSKDSPLIIRADHLDAYTNRQGAEPIPHPAVMEPDITRDLIEGARR
jgi:hypothetical protein